MCVRARGGGVGFPQSPALPSAMHYVLYTEPPTACRAAYCVLGPFDPRDLMETMAAGGRTGAGRVSPHRGCSHGRPEGGVWCSWDGCVGWHLGLRSRSPKARCWGGCVTKERKLKAHTASSVSLDRPRAQGSEISVERDLDPGPARGVSRLPCTCWGGTGS